MLEFPVIEVTNLVNCEGSVVDTLLMRERLIRDLSRDPGILILAYPYARTWQAVSDSAVRSSWSELTPTQAGTLYIHIPFCRRKCAFCDFLAYYERPRSEFDQYVSLLGEEMGLVGDMTGRLPLGAVQFGGGTPSLLTPDQMGFLMDSIRSRFDVGLDGEVSLEILPDLEVTEEHLKGWRQAGVNRLSFGVQCFDDEVKRGLGRIDKTSENLTLIEQSINLGYDNFNIDLICGVIGQSMESWLGTLDITLSLNPSHVCVFPVSVRHPGTALYEQRKSLPPPDLTRKMYDAAVVRLNEAGFRRMTRHDFAKPGFDYRYEKMIAELAPLVGIGANTISYSKDCIYRNCSNLADYAASLRRQELPIKAGHLFPDAERPHNYAVRNIEYLRLNGQEFQEQFGMSIRAAFGPQIEMFEEFGLARMVGEDLILTEEGVYYTSSVKRALFHPSAWERYENMKPEEFVIERGTLTP